MIIERETIIVNDRPHKLQIFINNLINNRLEESFDCLSIESIDFY